MVVSAPGRVTDHFIRLARRVARKPDERELDMLLSVGERMGMSLLAMAINDVDGFRAVSFTGSQVGIITDTRHTDASIIEVKGFRIREAIDKGMIPIIAGFQGISTAKEITTLGRGGSDATAVALAAAVGADRCELVKESGGIFSADPMLVSGAVHYREMDYSTLEAITSAGAKVVQPRAAGLASEHNVVLAVTSVEGERRTLVSDRSLSRAAIAAMTLREGVSLKPLGETGPLEMSDFISWTRDKGGAAITMEGGVKTDLVSVVGWGGLLSNEAAAVVSKAKDITPLALFRTPGVLTLVVSSGAGRDALKSVHKEAVAAGLFRLTAADSIEEAQL